VTWISVALAAFALAVMQAPAGATRRGPHRTHAPGHPVAHRGAQHGRRHRLGSRGVAQVAPPTPAGTWGRGSWCWFGDPRAVSVVGQYDQTFVGWIDWRGGIHVGAYDPAFGVSRSSTVGYLFHDDHGSPAIFVEPDKRITVFWSGHNGQTMYYRSTLRPEDTSAWGPVQRVPSRLRGGLGFTYPNPVLLPAENNKLYLFWRGAAWSADYSTRTLDGRWSSARELIRNPGQRPYVKVDGNGSDTIALAFTDGHPRNVLTSIYYAAYRSGWLWTAGGRRIARIGKRPIAPAQADIVYDAKATRVPSWVWDVALGSDGHPVIVYATFPSTTDHAYWYARWNGRRWVSHFLTFAGPSISPRTIEFEYSGGITLDHGDPSIVYLSRKVGRAFRIERWVTGNGGYGWRHEVVVRGGAVDNVRPVVPRGSDGGPMSLLWLRGVYGSYTGYRTWVDYLR
jgi:hypothetical protein